MEAMKMELNIDKSKIMRINNREQKLEIVTAYEYLGSIISGDGKLDLDVANRTRKNTKVNYALNKTICRKIEIDKHVKLGTYNTVVLPEMKYLRKVTEKSELVRRNSHEEDRETDTELLWICDEYGTQRMAGKIIKAGRAGRK